jgi:hypothetical protein
MILNIIVATVTSFIFPVVLKKLNIDPALVSLISYNIKKQIDNKVKFSL